MSIKLILLRHLSDDLAQDNAIEKDKLPPKETADPVESTMPQKQLSRISRFLSGPAVATQMDREVVWQKKTRRSHKAKGPNHW
ncbi:unnamed protein product [Clavelina lepadiformis]|uniref:Uncharacterized protein n=1 Tax=Clavelina lepadiformis TaxID=159417 RepID=A0ABP0FBR4_CLALP